jgi:hypothetical protein
MDDILMFGAKDAWLEWQSGTIKTRRVHAVRWCLGRKAPSAHWDPPSSLSVAAGMKAALSSRDPSYEPCPTPLALSLFCVRLSSHS